MDALKIKTRSLKGYVKRCYWTPEFEKMLNRIDRHFISGHERVDLLREVTVATISLNMSDTIRHLSVKYTRPMYFSVKFNIGKFIRNMFRPSKAGQSWRIAHTLLQHNIPVPAPVAFFDQRCIRALLKCYYIAEYLENAENLDNFLIRLNNRIMEEPGNDTLRLIRKRVIEETGKLIGRLHHNSFRHGDMGIGNIMIACEDGNNLHLYLVDIETITKYRQLPENEVAYDLACMYISMRKIFKGIELRGLIRAYLDTNHTLKPRMKLILTEVRTQAIQILQKHKWRDKKKRQYVEWLKAGEKVLFINSVREDGVIEIIDMLKKGFPKSEFKLLVINEDNLISQIRRAFSYISEIKQGAYGIVIDWHGSLMTAILTSLSGAELRMGYKSRSIIKNRLFYNSLVRVHSWSLNRKLMLLAPLKALGITINRA